MKRVLASTVVFTFLYLGVLGQNVGPWHHSRFDAPYMEDHWGPKGPVKLMILKTRKGEYRNIALDSNGIVLKDFYHDPVEKNPPNKFLFHELKKNYEKKYLTNEQDIYVKYNYDGQLTEHPKVNASTQNIFDPSGNILVHSDITKEFKTKPWGGVDHIDPTHEYLEYRGTLVLFRYHPNGLLNAVEMYDSSPKNDFKVVFEYNEKNQLIRFKRFDFYNIRDLYLHNNYLDPVLPSSPDTSFSIDSFYPGFWVGSPWYCEWKYNEKGEKIEYMEFDANRNSVFKSAWEYSVNGIVKKEIQYDVYGKILNIIDFDDYGNVLEEYTLYNDSTRFKTLNVQIEYYR